MSTVYLRADGRYHLAVMLGRQAATPAACDADENPDREIVWSVPEDGKRCRICFHGVSPLRADASPYGEAGWADTDFEGWPV